MRHLPTLATCLVLWACALAQVSPARADARSDRLVSFAPDELKRIDPLLARGPVALVGFARGDDLPAISVVTYVEAPADKVAEVIAQPERYPSFMPMLDRVQVASRHGSQIAYDWRFRVGVFVLEGNNRMHVMPPRKGKPGAPYRIAVYSERGHMGIGRLMWKVHPRGKRSLIELSMRVDMRDANVIMQQLDAAARSINRSINLALSYVMALGTKREVERQVGHVAEAKKASLEPPAVDPKDFSKLLERGDLVWLSTASHPRSTVWVLGRTGVSTAPVRAVMLDPESFGKGLVPGSSTEITRRTDAGTDFTWSIGLPLVGADGTMRMHEGEDQVVHVDATAGSLSGGKWRLETPRVSSWEACVEAWAQFDIADAGFLVRKVAEVDPTMGHGLAAATQVMMLRALRNRSWDEAQRMRAEKAAARAAQRAPKQRTPPAGSVPAKGAN